MSVVVKPDSAADRCQNEQGHGRHESRSTPKRTLEAGFQVDLGPAARHRHANRRQRASDEQPIRRRPEQRRDEVAVAVHVGIRVRSGVPEQVQCVLPAEARQDRSDHENPYDDAMPDKLVGHQRLDEHRQQSHCQHLRERDDVKFLGVLQQLVVVIAGDSLHQDAAKPRYRQHHQFDKTQCEQFRKPVRRLRHRQSVMDPRELSVSFAPDQLRRIQRRHDEEEQAGPALNRLQHQVGHRPHILPGNAPRIMAIVQRDRGHQNRNHPKRNLSHNVRNS